MVMLEPMERREARNRVTASSLCGNSQWTRTTGDLVRLVLQLRTSSKEAGHIGTFSRNGHTGREKFVTFGYFSVWGTPRRLRGWPLPPPEVEVVLLATAGSWNRGRTAVFWMAQEEALEERIDLSRTRETPGWIRLVVTPRAL